MKTLTILLLFIGLSFHLKAQKDLSQIEDFDQYMKDLKIELQSEGFPNIVFTDMEGNQFDIKSLKGKTVLINYWAFGCGPCFKEMPDLSKLVDKHDESVIFLSIIAPGNPNILSERLQNKILDTGFKYTHVATDKSFDEYGFLAVFPLHIVINKEGELIEMFTGVSLKRLEDAIAISNGV